ncbi:MAG: O-antigen ligase family protein [Sphingomonadaceae bacterium]
MSTAQRIAAALTVTNLVSTLLLLAGGVYLSRLLAAPRFGITLVLVAMLTIVPLALVLIAKPRFGVVLLFIVSMTIIEVKRLAWHMEVGLVVEFLEGVLAVALAALVIARRDLHRLSSPLTAPVLLYVAYQVVIAFHPNLPTTINIIYALRDPINFAVPFIAAVYLFRDRRQLSLFLYLWLGTAFVLALYGLFQYYVGLNNWETAWLSISPTHVLYNRIRIFSTLGSADALGMHMAVSIVIALAVGFHTRRKLVRYGVMAMVPVFAVANLQTLTRGAYVAVLVGVLTLALVTRNRALLLALVVAAAGVVIWYQTNQGSLLANRVITMFTPDQDESFEVRQNYIADYMPVIVESPFGFGPATSGRQGWVLLEWSGIDPKLAESIAGVPTDNYYFRIALETGWVGLLLFLGLLLTVFLVGLRIFARSRDPLVKWMAAAFIASYAAMAVSSLSNNYFSHLDMKLFFWFSLGLLANLPLIDAQSRQGNVVGEPVATSRLRRVRW